MSDKPFDLSSPTPHGETDARIAYSFYRLALGFKDDVHQADPFDALPTIERDAWIRAALAVATLTMGTIKRALDRESAIIDGVFHPNPVKLYPTSPNLGLVKGATHE